MIVKSSTSAFFPFNTGSDTTLESCDDCCSDVIALRSNVRYFGQSFSEFYISNNGIISFNEPVSSYTSQPFPVEGFPVIAPFWGDVYTDFVIEEGDAGYVYYRVEEGTSTAGTALDSTLSSNFGISFTSTFRIVVTWDQVGYFSEGIDKLNTFQTVISSNGRSSFACFFYADNGINWTTGDASGGENGLGGTPANVGFNFGDSVHYYSYPSSRTSEIVDIDDVVTAFGKGNFCFNIAAENIIATCTQNSDCNDGNECTTDECHSSLCQYSPNTENCACLDSDVDGVNDCDDGCPNDIRKTKPGVCGCGFSDNDNDCDYVAECIDVCHGVDDRVDFDNNLVPDCLSAPLSYDEVYPPWKCNINYVYVCNKQSTNSLCVDFDDVASYLNDGSYYFGKCYSACRSSYP